MVWHPLKRMFVIVALACLLVQPMTASAYNIYDEGNISSTYTSIFRDVVADIPITSDYVYFRSGQYSYTLAVGDFALSNNVIHADGSTKFYTITTNSGYNSNYKYDITEDNNFSLSLGDNLVYSNLADYPSLTERSVGLEITQTLILCVMFCCFVIRGIFQFTYRKRS